MAGRTAILVIDDDEHTRGLLEYSLRVDGFEVYLAEDGPTGLELARAKKPELILLDVMMPEMDGLEVLSELKHDKATQDIPVFMLTAKGMIRDVERAYAIGADDYMIKPFEPTEFGNIIRRKLDKRKKI